MVALPAKNKNIQQLGFAGNFLKQWTIYGPDEAYEEADNILPESEEFGRYVQMAQRGRRTQELKGVKDTKRPGSWKTIRSLQEKAIYEWSPGQAKTSKAHHQDTCESKLYSYPDTPKPGNQEATCFINGYWRRR